MMFINPPYLEYENIFSKIKTVVVLILAKVAIPGSTVVADFDLQPMYSFERILRKKEKSSQIGGRW
jgi:hypothetical protein